MMRFGVLLMLLVLLVLICAVIGYSGYPGMAAGIAAGGGFFLGTEADL